MNDSFLSIVECNNNPKLLYVRARVKGDIEKVFPKAKVYRDDKADYLYRSFIPRAVVAKALAAQVMKIDYGNFKNSVKEKDRHDAYLGCWYEMLGLQMKREPGLAVKLEKEPVIPPDIYESVPKKAKRALHRGLQARRWYRCPDLYDEQPVAASWYRDVYGDRAQPN